MTDDCFPYGSAEANGLFFFTGVCVVQLPSSISRDDFELAWTRLRHQIPAIGCTTSFNKDTRDWYYKYSVPLDKAEAGSWAKKTIIWHDDEKSLADRSVELADKYWNPADDIHACVLHVAPVSKALDQWALR